MPIVYSESRIQDQKRSLQNYITIKFYVVDDPNLSARAKGIFLIIFRLMQEAEAAGKVFYKKDIYPCCSEGHGAIHTAFQELEKNAYILSKRSGNCVTYFLREDI